MTHVVLAGSLTQAQAAVVPDGLRGVWPAQSSVSSPHLPAAADSLRLRLSFAERLHVSWARATVIRTFDPNALDIIVVGPETTVADLEKALRMLLSSYATTELPLRDELRAHVSGTAETPEPGELLTALAGGLDRVRDGTGFEIRDFGSLPSVVVDLPVEVEWYEPPM